MTDSQDNSHDNIDELFIYVKKNINDNTSIFYNDKTKFIDELKNKFKQTSNELSAVIQVVSQDSFNLVGLQRLEYMINMSKKVKDNNMTEHDASVAVGQRLVDDIVKPQLDE